MTHVSVCIHMYSRGPIAWFIEYMRMHSTCIRVYINVFACTQHIRIRMYPGSLRREYMRIHISCIHANTCEYMRIRVIRIRVHSRVHSRIHANPCAFAIYNVAQHAR